MKEMQDNGLAQIEKEMEPVETRPYTGLIDRYGNRVYLGDVVSVPDVFDYKCGAREFKHNKAVVVRSGNEYGDRKSTRLNSSHANISYAVFCLKKKKKQKIRINQIIRKNMH